VTVLCAIAIHADTAPTLAWILLGLNAIGAQLGNGDHEVGGLAQNVGR